MRLLPSIGDPCTSDASLIYALRSHETDRGHWQQKLTSEEKKCGRAERMECEEREDVYLSSGLDVWKYEGAT